MKKVLAVVAVVCVMCVAGSALAQHAGHGQPGKMNHPRMMLNALEAHSRDHRPHNVSGDFRGAHRDSRHGQHGQQGHNKQSGHEGMRCGFDGRQCRGPVFTPDMPKEIREKAAELAKLRIDLEEAMTSRPINKEKALEVHAKMQTVKNEIETWRFTKRLERIEARQEHRKKLPPDRHGMPEAPAPEAPAPEEAQ